MAEHIPTGTAASSAVIVMIMVLTRAGNIETFSLEYCREKSSGERLGIPRIRIYPTRKTIIRVVTAADAITRNLSVRDRIRAPVFCFIPELFIPGPSFC
jgi:hypothetical protein